MATKSEIYKSKQKQFKTTQHQFNKKVCHWWYCSGCGLVLLKNEPSLKRSREPCYSMEVLTAYENPTKSKEIG